MDLFREFIATNFEGNQSLAAAALNVDKSLVSRILRGNRRVTPDMAARIEQLSNGRFAKERFIWPEAV